MKDVKLVMTQNLTGRKVNLSQSLDNSLDNVEKILEKPEFNNKVLGLFEKFYQKKQTNSFLFRYELCKLSKEIDIPAEDLSNLFKAYCYDKYLQDLRKSTKFQNSNFLQKTILEFYQGWKYNLIDTWDFLQTPIFLNFKNFESHIGFFSIMVGMIVPMWGLKFAYDEGKEERTQYTQQLEMQNKQLEMQNKQLEMDVIDKGWNIIIKHEGKEQNLGRIKAIENLNKLNTSLNRVNLSNADLTGLDLKTGTEHSAKLAKATFNEAVLYHANLSGADLIGSEFKGAKLGSANLTGANLTGAIFGDANCTETEKINDQKNLKCANLNKTDLRNVEGLTPEQVKRAYNWKAAIYSENFCKKFSEEDRKLTKSCNQYFNSDNEE